MKKLGFTLAEILITLTIIGVVAAVTLPSLQTNMSNRGLETKTTKFYRNLSEAVGRCMAENDADNLTNSGIPNAPNDFIVSYFKVAKRCMKPFEEGAFAGSYNNFDGSPNGSIVPDSVQPYVLTDGSVFYYEPAPADSLARAVIKVDINGPDRPNRIGYDYWEMYIFEDGSVDEFSINEAARLSVRNGSSSQQQIQAVFEKSRDEHYTYGFLGKFIHNGYKFTADWR